MRAVAGILAGILVAVCAAAHFQLWGLCLNLEIKPVDVATFLVTVFIAGFLQHYLATQVPDRRAEKNILIDNCRDCATVLKNCRDVFWACYESGKLSKANMTSILGYVRSLANGLESLEAAIELSQFASIKGTFQPVKDAYFNYKNSLTGGGFPAKPYRTDAFAEHEGAYRTLSNRLQALTFEINKQR